MLHILILTLIAKYSVQQIEFTANDKLIDFDGCAWDKGSLRERGRG
jgi:hypothetical protein